MGTYAIDKSEGPRNFDGPAWREGLARAAARAIENRDGRPFRPPGPFQVKITMRDGPAVATKLARRWQFENSGDAIVFQSPDMRTLYMNLIRLCYLTPRLESWLPIGLRLYDLWGRSGRGWVRRRLRRARRTARKRGIENLSVRG
jgi:hypothetical protein